MFKTTLQVAHIDEKEWRLTTPLVWEGKWEYFVIREGFETDFASIPKPVRWLLDNAGRNTQAAVLHDAAWRESTRPTGSRIDPWNADGVFRRALRQTGSPALTRGLMWFAVRFEAMRRGRLGKLGPPLPVKILQLAGMFVLGLITAAPATIVVTVALVVYWVFSWLVAAAWATFERAKKKRDPEWREEPNWPWPANRRYQNTAPFAGGQLHLLAKPHHRGDGSAEDRQIAALEARLDAVSDRAIKTLSPGEIQEILDMNPRAA